jgi:hypothetical protein
VYLTNCKEPAIALWLTPWYISIDQTREEIGLELYTRLKYSPDDTLFGIFREAGKGVRGVFAAYCRDDDVFIWQANAPRNKYVKLVFDTVIAWARAKGFDKIRLISTRRQPIKKRFGFVNRGIELEKRI